MKHLESEYEVSMLVPDEKISSPFSKFLNIETNICADKKVYQLKYKKEFVGNPSLEAFHGGIVSTFIEISSQLFLLSETPTEELKEAETLTVDFLRPSVAKNGPLLAVPSIVRKGKNVCVLGVDLFQNQKLVAKGKVIYLEKR